MAGVQLRKHSTRSPQPPRDHHQEMRLTVKMEPFWLALLKPVLMHCINKDEMTAIPLRFVLYYLAGDGAITIGISDSSAAHLT